eukprot:Skav236643  [mRNA]  locus=scaffold2983:33264:50894:- [translate_table: standard]
MEVNVTSTTEESPLDYQGVEILVTEHWDARCLNNGLFYVRASYRTLIFFNLFLRQIYVNPYTDNQNLFDAFLSHSTTDAAVPDARPVLRYALLDIDQQFGCAEGHANNAEGQGGLVTFHFWASDFRTREAAETEKGSPPSGQAAAGGRIVARDGVERVEKIRAKKDELFEAEEAALRRVAELAVEEKTGARALVTILEKVLRNFKFELPSTTCTELLLTAEMVEDPARILPTPCDKRALQDLLCSAALARADVNRWLERVEKTHLDAAVGPGGMMWDVQVAVLSSGLMCTVRSQIRVDMPDEVRERVVAECAAWQDFAAASSLARVQRSCDEAATKAKRRQSAEKVLDTMLRETGVISGFESIRCWAEVTKTSQGTGSERTDQCLEDDLGRPCPTRLSSPTLSELPVSDSEILTERSLEVTMSDTPRAGEIHLASPDACSVRRSQTMDSCAGSPEANSGTDRVEMPLHFMSRLDDKEHYGQLIRNVELLGRRYLVVRTEPSEEDSHQGCRLAMAGAAHGWTGNVGQTQGEEPGRSELTAATSQLSWLSDVSCGPKRKVITLCTAPGGRLVRRMAAVMRRKRRSCVNSYGKKLGKFQKLDRYERLDANGRGVESYAVKEVDLQILRLDCRDFPRDFPHLPCIKLQMQCCCSAFADLISGPPGWVLTRRDWSVRNLLKLRGHPGVVKVLDAFAFRRKFYIVMEYVNGTDLGRSHCEEAPYRHHLGISWIVLDGPMVGPWGGDRWCHMAPGRLSEIEARGLFAQMAEALRHSHALDVVHRDRFGIPGGGSAVHGWVAVDGLSRCHRLIFCSLEAGEDFKPHNILLASPLRPGQPDVVKLVDFGLSKDGR